ncbi:esterase family protein [Rufibacter immobilis]|uniref:Esterase family protein n=1 Tax=Rufibacter immobilis TaxID=1348778 RepID=A0A3M9N6U1_9BACT|nr:alpha/beta hydrolase-fold protein [Rufibacter immobilis]RNI33017.1 esterase family protein [Rufibacter immobilis]
MKNLIRQCMLFLLLLLISWPVLAQQGTLKESLKTKSKILGYEVDYSIYLPSDYEKSNRRYPVLYLLHGYTDDETGWAQFGEAHLIAGRLMQAGQIPPMLIVMPDAGVTWYVNSVDGKVKFEDFFVKEFIPHIDKEYRTRNSKAYRAVAGLSMGGYGSLILSMKHPELFAAVAPLSAAVYTNEEFQNITDERYTKTFASIYGQYPQGQQRLSAHWYQNSVLKIIETTPVDSLKKMKYYIDCGDDDFLIKGNMALHAALIDKKVPHEFRVRDGGHTWTYWRTALPEVLKFVGETFHR